MNLTGILAKLREHYDKLLAVAALAVLLICLVSLQWRTGIERARQQQFNVAVEEMKPSHPQAAKVDVAAYSAAKARLENPFQLEAWTNQMMFVPETRVWCVDCKRPIPMRAKVCPFCKAEQPPEAEDDPERDLDRDGMKDVWELKHGLNPHDGTDATVDSDGDGFLNVEEFRYGEKGTDPQSADDHPPVTAKLSVKAIKPNPFKFLFKSASKMPDGTIRFQVNAQGDRETFFMKIGETNAVSGFVVQAYEPKIEEVDDPSVGKIRKDKSVLSIRVGEKIIPLVRGEPVPHTEYTATLLSRVDNSEFVVKPEQVFEVKGEKFKVISIDSKKDAVVIERAVGGERFELGKFPQAEEKQPSE